MSKRSLMILDAFRPSWGWNPLYIRAADRADRWKLAALRFCAGILIAILFVLLGGHILHLSNFKRRRYRKNSGAHF
jgi:hypothetical protein